MINSLINAKQFNSYRIRITVSRRKIWRNAIILVYINDLIVMRIQHCLYSKNNLYITDVLLISVNAILKLK